MTARLYYTDSYLTTFDARVVERADDGRRVYLDRTAFYPTSGGQPNDFGMLDASAVTDVLDEGERIAHVLESPLPAGAEAVHGQVDWERRFDHMQQHTGQHLLSAVLAEMFGHRTVSVHFGRDYSSLDLDVDVVSAERLAAAETRANAVVQENRPVTVAFESAATASGLRKESARQGDLRIVTIADLDRSACGGTHVRATGEIGSILVRRQEKIRKSARIEFVCGQRAVHRARADFEALSRIAGSMSASLDDAAALVAAQREQLQLLEAARRRLERELAGYRARALYDEARPDAEGVRRVVLRDDRTSMEELRTLAQAFVSLPKAVLLGAVTTASPPALLLASSDDSGLDAGRVLREAVTAAGGRGGGSSRLAQGSVPDSARIDAVLEAVSQAR